MSMSEEEIIAIFNDGCEDEEKEVTEFLNAQEIDDLIDLANESEQYKKEPLSLEEKENYADDLYLYKQKLKWLDDIPNGVLLRALKKEPSDIVAIILLLLDKKRSNEIFTLLDLDMKESINLLIKMANGFHMDEKVVYIVLDGLKNSILHISDLDEEFYKQKFDFVIIYDKKKVPYILNRYCPRSLEILHSINSLDHKLAYIIRDSMFEFDDIFKVFKTEYLFKILSNVEIDNLALSIFNKDESYKLKLKEAMSQRTAERFEEEISMWSNPKLSDIEEAQVKVLNSAKNLLERGEIERDLSKY